VGPTVARVAARVEHGGHPVPEDRIRARYVRNQPLIRQAVLMADRAFVFDNSALGKPPRLLIRFQAGVAWRITDGLPSWAASLYGDSLR
jgi:predicted ABC-type ATPase